MPENKYKDYFFVDQNFKPCMSKDAINETPDYWKNFYPHESFVKFLHTVLSSLSGSEQTVWLGAAYGTGKSHAVLVLQKLLTDDSTRVKDWLEEHKERISESVRTTLWNLREQKPLVIYDCGTDGIYGNNAANQFLVRLQQSIIAALKERNISIPVMGKLDELLEQIRNIETHFFKKRDEIQVECVHLKPEIKNANDLKKQLDENDEVPGLVNDIMLVCERLHFYPNLSVDDFKNWIKVVLEMCNIPNILYIWDEFSTFIDRNSNQLTTFQEVANMAQDGQFYLLPVTHMKLESYLATGSESAKKVMDRFIPCSLDMPTNTALLLAGHALKVIPGREDAWKQEKTKLWKTVKPIVSSYMAELDDECKSNQDAFEGVMPIHPMTAVMLKFLATMTGSNQRSMFSFLKGDQIHKEFQTFMAQGGPYEFGKQYLTVDYLWSYFIERDDLGSMNKDVSTIRMEFNRKSKTLDANETRVFKAVLLFSLLDSMTTSSGANLIQPTRQNIEQCFFGAGINNILDYLKSLENKHCLSLIDDRCQVFRGETNSQEIDREKQEILSNFKKYVCDDDPDNTDEVKLAKALENKIKQTNNDKLHFIVRCSTPDKVNQTCQASKELFGPDGNKVLVQFIVSPTFEQHQIAALTAKTLAESYKKFRMLFVVTPDIFFCSYDQKNWEEYAEYRAKANQANSSETKAAYRRQTTQILEKWKERLFESTQRLQIYTCSPEGIECCEEKKWETIIPYLHKYLKDKFEYFLDDLSEYNTSAMTENTKTFKPWAEAGLTNTGIGAQKGVLKSLSNKGIDATADWFEANPTHPLTELRNHCKNKLENALKSGKCSVRKILADLVKPPFGLLYVPYTAFIMGVAMREWLDKSRRVLQWVDNVQSDPLDAKVLAGIIEDAIKDKGNGAIANEKFVCRTSPEERAFIEAAPVMFGIVNEANANVKSVLGKIAERLLQISNKAPLWALKGYISEHEEPGCAKNIADIIDKICQSMTISGRDRENPQSNPIKAAGEIIRSNQGIAQQIQKYVNTDVFDKAFKQYVDNTKPELCELAHVTGDNDSLYCQSIKDRCAETSSWLWKSGDIDKELNAVYAQYQIIQLVQWLIGQSGFVSYSNAEERLKKAFFTDNKISLDVLAGDYPAISDLINLFNNIKVGDNGYSDFVQALNAYKEQVKIVFFDPTFKVQIDTLKKLFGNQLEMLGESDVKEIYHRLSSQAKVSENDFRQITSQSIDFYLKESVGSQLKSLWKNKTGSATPQEWSESHRLPVNVLFDTDQEAAEMVGIIQYPASYQADRLQAALERLKEISFSDNERELQATFLKTIVPAKYQKLDIDPDKLLEYLVENVSNNPNLWLNNYQQLSEQVEAYIRNSYQENYSAKAVNIVNGFDANQAKTMLLEFIKQYPDIGLKILEDANGH